LETAAEHENSKTSLPKKRKTGNFRILEMK